MKNKTQKIAKYSGMALAAAAVLPLACSKDKEADDPNITFRTVDSTVTPTVIGVNVYKYIDIDNNGVIDAQIYAWETDGPYEFRGTIIGAYAAGFKVLTTIVPVNGGDREVLRTFNSGDQIDSTLTDWNSFGYASMKKTGPPVDNIGFDGQGEKLVGFRFKAGLNTHYGWARIRVTNDGKNLTLKELAFDIRPGNAIKAGAK